MGENLETWDIIWGHGEKWEEGQLAQEGQGNGSFAIVPLLFVGFCKET